MGLIGLEHGVDSSAQFVVGTCNAGNMLKPAPDCYVLRNEFSSIFEGPRV